MKTQNLVRNVLVPVLLGLFLLFSVPTPAAHAGTVTLTVNTSSDTNPASPCAGVAGDCSLRAAISRANGDPGNSYMIIIPSGTYTLTRAGAGEDNNATGDLDVKASLTLSGAGAPVTIINGNSLDRVFDIRSGYQATISGVQIKNGKAPSGPNASTTGGSGSPGENGGGLRNAATLIISNSTITANTAGKGGNGGDGTASIAGGAGGAGGNGGGIYNQGVLTLNNTAISDNNAGAGGTGGYGAAASFYPGGPGGAGGAGGAIYNSGTLNASGSGIANNHAGAGGNGGAGQNAPGSAGNGIRGGNGGVGGNGGRAGGIYSSGPFTLASSTVSGSTGGQGGTGGAGGNGGDGLSYKQTNGGDGGNGGAGGNGGGAGGVFTGSTATVKNTTISGNSSGDAGNGGTAGAGGYPGCAGDTCGVPGVGGMAGAAGSKGDGGGVSNIGGTMNLNNATITLNSARIGGGVDNLSGTASVRNSILANNTATLSSPDCAGSITSQGYNLVVTATGCTIAGDATGNMTGQDPKLVALASNGGSVQTHALQSDSPVIDTGNPAAPGSGGNACESTDARGQARNDLRCDRGAFEAKLSDLTGVLRCGLAANTYSFGPTYVQVQVTTPGTLSCLSVQRTETNHPSATEQYKTGRYWTLTPTGSGYTVNLSLYQDLFAPSYGLVGHYTGNDTWYGVQGPSTAHLITRNGVTNLLGDWAVGSLPLPHLYLPLVER